MQQALLMAGHSIGEPQGMLLDHQEGLSSAGESKRGGKRELSTSKRAAQNRQAQVFHNQNAPLRYTLTSPKQRAFRQRKEGHIKKLEEQVRDYQTLAESFKAVQSENYQLRDYIINLQSRLIESQGDFPPAPSNIDLRQPIGGVPSADGSVAAGQNGTSAEPVQDGTIIKENKNGIDPALSHA